jgi:hypothetical protein
VWEGKYLPQEKYFLNVENLILIMTRHSMEKYQRRIFVCTTDNSILLKQEL